MKSLDFPVSILLATLNGAAHLRAQIRSLHAQEHTNWHILLSDDGSSDETVEIARSSLHADQLEILKGPQSGLAQNFWNALMHVPTGSYAAFCDQDDIWRADKLSRALTHLASTAGPTLYSSGRFITDQSLGIKHQQSRRPVGHFAHLLWRNKVAGHTCVLNPKAVQILKQHPPPVDVPFHDWWAALVLKGVGAAFIHDPYPSLLYRQHKTNVLGAKGGRMRKVLDGTYVKWVRANLNGLIDIQDHLQPNALRVCLLTRAALSLKLNEQRSDHVRQHQQQTRRRGIFD